MTTNERIAAGFRAHAEDNLVEEAAIRAQVAYLLQSADYQRAQARVNEARALWAEAPGRASRKAAERVEEQAKRDAAQATERTAEARIAWDKAREIERLTREKNRAITEDMNKAMDEDMQAELAKLDAEIAAAESISNPEPKPEGG
jgi:hypothetical protein